MVKISFNINTELNEMIVYLQKKMIMSKSDVIRQSILQFYKDKKSDENE